MTQLELKDAVLPKTQGRPNAAVGRALACYRKMITATTERREHHWGVLLSVQLEELSPQEQAHYYAGLIATREEAW
jgi:hypothetical protein